MGNSEITRIRIEALHDNPHNFYALRDIESLANMISRSRFVAPLIVTPDSETAGTYIIISGHRRKAAWKLLLEQGTVQDTTLPCIIRTFAPVTLEDGEVLSSDSQQDACLVFSNMGQRQNLTIAEKLAELAHLEPYAQTLWRSQKAGERGNFRTFFAKKVLKIGEGSLQRMQSLKNLCERARQAIDDGKVSTAFGLELATLPPDEQEDYLNEVESGMRGTTSAELHQYKQQNHLPEPAEEEAAEELPPEEDALPETADESTPADTFEPEAEEDEPAETEEPPAEEADQTMLTHLPTPKIKTPGVLEFSIPDVSERAMQSQTFKPQDEAQQWVKKCQVLLLQNLLAYAQDQVALFADSDELQSSQWNMRAAALRVKLILFQQKQAS